MIALTFTDACVYIADCVGGGGRMTVQQFLQAPLPEGAVQNGAVADAKLVRAVLEQAFAAHGFGKVREVTITAVSTLASNSEYMLPYTKNRKHLETMLRAEVMQALTGSDYVFDYTEETVFEDEGAQKCRVNVYVLPRSMIKGYEELLDDMGIKRRSFDAEKNCLLRFSQYFNADFTGAVLVYADEKVATLVAMCENGSTIMRRYPLHMAGTRDQAYEELALQIVKISQFKQISLPGSRVEAVYLFGSQVDAQAVADVREICGYATAILGQPTALRAPEGFDFKKFVFAVAACLPVPKVSAPKLAKVKSPKVRAGKPKTAALPGDVANASSAAADETPSKPKAFALVRKNKRSKTH